MQSGSQYFAAGVDYLDWCIKSKYGGNPHWRMIHFYAGLAVECILRGIVDETSDKRTSEHSLQQWFNNPNVVPLLIPTKGGASIGVLASRAWRSNDRYRPEGSLYQELAERHNFRVQGDILVHCVNVLIDTAQKLIELYNNRGELKRN